MNYGELQTMLASRSHRGDLAADIPGFIEFARTRINRDMRVREQLTVTDITPVSNPFAVPSDFLEARELSYTRHGRRVSLRLSPRWQINLYDSANAFSGPQFYSVDGLQIQTMPGGEGTEFRLMYYATVPQLVGDTDTNLLMSVYPSIWLNASLVELHDHAQDDELQAKALDIYNSEVNLANGMAKQAEAGAALQMTGASAWL